MPPQAAWICYLEGMKTHALLRLIPLLAVATPLAASPVQTESGSVEGVRSSGSKSYKGIPYAAPPVGSLRWRPPQHAAAWPGVRQADHHSSACPQIGNYPADAEVESTSEDCLTLNLWVPQHKHGAKLPVMVWIHGGGLSNGSGSIPQYAGDRLARRGVIVVTFNYRLGVLGFLSHPELSREDPNGASGNYGLLDQIAALEWVKHNIGAFGGDPQKVTVFGQSSGAFSLSALVVSPKAKGLFQRVIAQSGGIFEPVELDPLFTAEGAAAAGSAFARRAGALSLADLRKLPVETLLKIPFRPQFHLDGKVLTATPRAAYAAGAQQDVDLLLGSNADEATSFLDAPKLTLANYHAVLEQTYPAALIGAVGLAAAKSDDEARLVATALDTDLRFRWDMWAWANRAQRGNHRIFLYEFDRAPAFSSGQYFQGKGATHGVEMAYAFDQLDLLKADWTKEDRRLAELMATYWTNFAKTGNPNARGLPPWPAFTGSGGQVMHLDVVPMAKPVRDEARLQRIEQVWTTFAASAASAKP